MPSILLYIIALCLSIGRAGGTGRKLAPEAKDAADEFKMEDAGKVGVNLKQGCSGDLTGKQAGSAGGPESL